MYETIKYKRIQYKTKENLKKMDLCLLFFKKIIKIQ